jgi:nucleoside-diphosphate-sugar epimerase
VSTVLVFGASGFIGSHVRALLEADPRITRVVSPGRSRLDLLAADEDQVAGLLDETQPDVVVHCMGVLDGSRRALLAANTLSTATIIDALASSRPGTRLVRIGSAGEYGVIPHGQAVREDQPASPLSPYGLSHLAATRLVELARDQGQIDGVTLRVFNPIGPGLSDATLLGRAVTRLREALADARDSIVMGPLDAHRDFVDVRDVATAVVAAVHAPELPTAVLNIGSGQAVTTRSAVEELARVSGFAGTVHEQGVVGGRSAAVGWSQADISRAAGVLGWKPMYDLQSTITDIWKAAGDR